MQIWFSKCLFKLHFLPWNWYPGNSPRTIRSKLKTFKFSKRLLPLWNNWKVWWFPWQQFFIFMKTKDNVRNLFTFQNVCIQSIWRFIVLFLVFFCHKTKIVRMWKNSTKYLKSYKLSRVITLGICKHMR